MYKGFCYHERSVHKTASNTEQWQQIQSDYRVMLWYKVRTINTSLLCRIQNSYYVISRCLPPIFHIDLYKNAKPNAVPSSQTSALKTNGAQTAQIDLLHRRHRLHHIHP